jgi:hypothetical protein
MKRSTFKRLAIGISSVCTCFLVVFLAVRAEAINHPFLIVKEADYPELQERATRSPWREMKAEAVRQTQQLTYSAETDNGRNAGYKLRDGMGYAALAYILDPANRADYVYKIKSTLETALADMQAEHGAAPERWDTNVPFQGGVFNAILALDIIHDDLSATDRTSLEIAIDQLVNRFAEKWVQGPHSVAFLWGLYRADRTQFSTELQAFDDAWTVDITNDGVYVAGPGYANSRLNSCSREHKSLGMDIAAYHGFSDYYSRKKFVNLHEWLYGYSHTPDFRAIVFGDTLPQYYLMGGSPNTPANCGTQAYRAYRFGSRVKQSVNWHLQDNHGLAGGNAATRPNGRLLTYLLMGDQAPDLSNQKVSPSRIFSDGGAWLMEQNPSRQALVGALWNVRQVDEHSHKETNALYLGGYGVHLLSNSGYTGWRRGVGDFSWNYIHDRAVSANTGLIDYEFDPSQAGDPPEENDHQRKDGAGIQEGLLTPTFDYARGDSGEALPNGKHFRNFHFVHPGDGKSGYWFLVDEFTAGNKAHLAFHPYSRAIKTLVADAEYQADIVDYGNQEITDVDLTLFLGTPPEKVTLHNGAIAGPNIENQYLYPTYARGAGVKQILTVLFPSNSDHPKPTLSRISSEQFSGAVVDQGDVVDYLLESDSSAPQTLDGATFQARRSFFRLVDNQLRSFYAAGKAFEYEANGSKTGMRAEQEIVIYLRDRSGQIHSPAPQALTLYAPNIAGVILNDAPANVTQSGAGWVQINVPAGTSSIVLN